MLRFIFCEKYECTVCIEHPDCCFIGDKTEIPYPPTHKWRLLPHCWGSGTHNSSSWYSHWCWVFKSSFFSEPLIGILKRWWWADNDVGELVESGVEAGALSLSLSYYRVTVAQRSATAIRKCHNKTLMENETTWLYKHYSHQYNTNYSTINRYCFIPFQSLLLEMSKLWNVMMLAIQNNP